MTALEFNYELVQIKDHLRRFAFQLTMNSENAEDLLQDTYIKALSNSDKFRENINFKAWTLTIMRNIFINDYRRNQKNKRIDKTPDHFTMVQRVTDHNTPDNNISVKQINDALNNLDPEYQVPLAMHIQGYKYKEIAERLNLKMGTVKSRIFLSRKKLATMLRDRINPELFTN
jgi:RNA polymerase sigma-70 factor (ECF subfamily)